MSHLLFFSGEIVKWTTSLVKYSFWKEFWKDLSYLIWIWVLKISILLKCKMCLCISNYSKNIFDWIKWFFFLDSNFILVVCCFYTWRHNVVPYKITWWKINIPCFMFQAYLMIWFDLWLEKYLHIKKLLLIKFDATSCILNTMSRKDI